MGIPTLVEYLSKKDITVESNPNTKISHEHYALLINEFGKNLSPNKRAQLLSQAQTPKQTPPQQPKEAAPSVNEEAKKETPKNDVISEKKAPKLVIKGKIDLDKKPKVEEKKPVVVEKKPTVVEEKPAVVEKKQKVERKKPIVVEEKKPAVVEEKKPVVVEAPKEVPPVKVEEKVVEKPAEPEVAKTEENESVFRLNTGKLESNVKVMGKIDLSALNQSTRPKKKTKEEKKKERDDKRSAGGNKPNGALNKGGNKQNGTPTANNAAKPNASGVGVNGEKKKRSRIKKDKVDVNNTPGTNAPRPSHNQHGSGGNQNSQDKNKKGRFSKRPTVKVEVSEEDVQKQVKETLARLTNKQNKQNKGAKYRRDKRDAAVKREHEMMELEERESRILKLTEFVTANDLANMMDVPVTKVIGTCMSIGLMVSINQRLDAETINIVAEEFGFETEYVSAEVVEAIKDDSELDNEADWEERPPIVTVMGHVDHGKTSLLDGIRNANVIAGEAGGITQHIGAYNVQLPSGRRITFLDTPGHEAFTAMRARGAKVTDIAIIIVAADDNVMPQTVEAINHASAAGVPIVFAINKVDKPHANPEKIKEELANMNYLVEDWGGKYQSQDISAKKGTGVEELLEKVLLEADLLDLKANPKRRANGSIIESSLDKGRGYVSTILVENGSMHVGDIVLAGTHYGRIKAMFNERNVRVEKAGPSEPVLILGLNGAPQAGDTFNILESDQEAREIAVRREQLQRELGIRAQKLLTLDDIGRRIAVGNFQELNVIVKGDVDGSVEALSDSLMRMSTEEIQVKVIHKAVGQISESDVVLAAASNAIIIGFQVRPALPARRLAEKDGVEIRLYSIIYDAINEIKSAMEGMLAPEVREEITANVEVQQVFKITKVGTVAGCMVMEGKIKRTNKIRLIRDGIVVYSGELGSLKRFKDDAKEVVAGLDCGLNITNFNDIQVGDIIESYEETEIKKTL